MTSIYGQLFSRNPLSPSHLKVIELVGFSKRVLELGSSAGYLTKQFYKNGCHVDIVEKDKDDAQMAEKYASSLYLGSLEEENLLRQINNKYDVIVAADVLEHLKNPENLLRNLKKNLKKTGKLVISLPNIACWQIRKDLFFKGRFEYQEYGILDKTHLKFFTYYSIQELLKSLRFRIFNIYPMETDYPLRHTILKFGFFGKIFDQTIGDMIIRTFPNLCTGHIIIEAKIDD